MPKKLTPREFAELARSMPGASEGQLIEAALMKEFGDDPRLPAGLAPPHIPGAGRPKPGPIPDPRTLEAGMEEGVRQSVGEHPYARLGRVAMTPLYQPEMTPERETSVVQSGFDRFRDTMHNVGVKQANALKTVGGALSAPVDIAGLAAAGIGGVAGRAGLLGISKAARLAEAASNVPIIGEGLRGLVQGEGALEKGVGAVQATLGGYGARSALTHSFPVDKVRETYLREAGRSTAMPTVPKTWDQDLAIRTADAFEAMKHAPGDPQVRASYEALAKEVEDEFLFVRDRAGLRMEPSSEGYAGSAEMTQDVTDNNRLRYFPTEEGFGSGDLYSDNPLYAVSPKTGLRYNDMLRAVHDYYGHAGPKLGFGPVGERGAYLHHGAMMPEEARPALTTETHGQNSWVNAGPHLRTQDGSLPKAGEPGYVHPSARPFADQKAGLLPSHIIDPPEGRFLDAEQLTGPNTPLEDGTPYGILSAANPGTTLTEAENLARHQQMVRDLRGEYYRPLEQKGVYGKEPEPSVLVPGLSPDDTVRYGKKYGQEAVISNAGWHRNADDATFPRSAPTVFDPAADNYYSELREVVLPDGRRVRYQQQFPDAAYEAPPGSAVPTDVPESPAASTQSTSGTSVESTIQRQAKAPAGSLIDNVYESLSPELRYHADTWAHYGGPGAGKGLVEAFAADPDALRRLQQTLGGQRVHRAMSQAELRKLQAGQLEPGIKSVSLDESKAREFLGDHLKKDGKVISDTMLSGVVPPQAVRGVGSRYSQEVLVDPAGVQWDFPSTPEGSLVDEASTAPKDNVVPFKEGNKQPGQVEQEVVKGGQRYRITKFYAPELGRVVTHETPLGPATSGPSIELLDADGPGLNASGESAASLEAQSRLSSMKEKGEQIVFIGPDSKTIRPVAATVDGVDVEPPKGWRKGVRGKDGRIRLMAMMGPTASFGIGEGGFSTGDEDTDNLIRAALAGSAFGVLKVGQVKKLVTALPELKLGRFIKRVGDDAYQMTDEVPDILRGWWKKAHGLPGGAGVWARQNELVAPAFDGQTGIHRQFNFLQGATSPRTDLAQSTQEALAALAAGLRDPGADVITREMMLDEGLQTMHNSIAKLPNINRSLRGEPLQSGDHVGKAQEYGDLINMGLDGSPEELLRGQLANPPDLHGMGMISEDLTEDFTSYMPELRDFFAFHEGTPAPGQRGAINPQGVYDRFRAARTDAWRKGVPEVPVSEAFADGWGARRHSLGIPEATLTPADLLRARGLLEPGALLDPDIISMALRRGDWPKSGTAGLASARTKKARGY